MSLRPKNVLYPGETFCVKLEKVVDEALELSLKFYSFFKKHEIGRDVNHDVARGGVMYVEGTFTISRENNNFHIFSNLQLRIFILLICTIRINFTTFFLFFNPLNPNIDTQSTPSLM